MDKLVFSPKKKAARKILKHKLVKHIVELSTTLQEVCTLCVVKNEKTKQIHEELIEAFRKVDSVVILHMM